MIGWCPTCEQICEGDPIVFKPGRSRRNPRRTLIVDYEGRVHDIYKNVLENPRKPREDTEESDADN